ncbi:Unannotated [Lentimonas sp. CC4]|uniref:hypothetical protein n=2 Tax=Lentimonas TaxID=417293 RepID=UPI0013273B76|nr:hypothetical protein [Lentimonas sp. CC4]CAA6684937.1 Unannotated [Lentimonas sp. CC6]CAA7169872.1 Unannotated [Lentimonas sp. CC21]CAA7181472.1 Unannotated [Lentimonas sp. CC8]CAA6677673.1 Unannotated [Lentimonas sp. CC4]CAA7077951.1 Unannotated [Lentimonas sp. CC4]
MTLLDYWILLGKDSLMKNRYIKVILPLLASFTISQTANAEVLAEFNFDGRDGVSTGSSMFSIVSDWDNSHAGASSDYSQNAHSFRSVAVTAVANEISRALDPSVSESYHSFTVTVAGLRAGEALDLTTFAYEYKCSQPLGFDSGVYSDATGFSSLSDQLGGITIGGDGADLSTSINLSGPEYKGLTNGDSIEFRIYLADTSNSPKRIHNIDDVILTGEKYDIPEPDTFALIAGIVAICSMMTRRRS